MGGFNVVFLQRFKIFLVHVAILHLRQCLFHERIATGATALPIRPQEMPRSADENLEPGLYQDHILLICEYFYHGQEKMTGQKKCPPPVREEGIFWSDVSVFLRPVTLVRVAVLPRLVVIIPLMPTIATF